mmetsp:Transcript_145149/g.404464  ORF Transcript_145149/g.404464 Transcript_145149/m.404464 type:complete len:230 (-) Transcript_145149:84-773(-)
MRLRSSAAQPVPMRAAMAPGQSSTRSKCVGGWRGREASSSSSAGASAMGLPAEPTASSPDASQACSRALTGASPSPGSLAGPSPCAGPCPKQASAIPSSTGVHGEQSSSSITSSSDSWMSSGPSATRPVQGSASCQFSGPTSMSQTGAQSAIGLHSGGGGGGGAFRPPAFSRPRITFSNAAFRSSSLRFPLKTRRGSRGSRTVPRKSGTCGLELEPGSLSLSVMPYSFS